MGIQLGALNAMAPGRRKDFARVVLRALIAGNVACHMTACIAGRLLLLVRFNWFFAACGTISGPSVVCCLPVICIVAKRYVKGDQRWCR